MALEDLLETLTEIVELVEDESPAPRAPEPSFRAVESLEERLPLSAEGAVPLESIAMAENEAAPVEAKASFLPPPSIPANLVAELHRGPSPGTSGKPTLTDRATVAEALGELQQESATQAHQIETPETPRDGRIASKAPEPLERSNEQDERPGDQERLEIPELEPKDRSSGQDDCRTGSPLKEDGGGADASDDDKREEDRETMPAQSFDDDRIKTGPEDSFDLVAKTDLRFVASIGDDLDRPDLQDGQEHKRSSSNVESNSSRDDIFVVEKAGATRGESSAASDADDQSNALSPLVHSMPLGTNSKETGEQTADEAKAHDACFSPPVAQEGRDNECQPASCAISGKPSRSSVNIYP